MKPRSITLPELGMIAGTRAALGAGIALLLADQMDDEQRRAVGWTLLAVGVLSTIPLAAEILHQNGDHAGNGHPENPELQEARFKV
jgi:hypothetical protein